MVGRSGDLVRDPGGPVDSLHRGHGNRRPLLLHRSRCRRRRRAGWRRRRQRPALRGGSLVTPAEPRVEADGHRGERHGRRGRAALRRRRRHHRRRRAAVSLDTHVNVGMVGRSRNIGLAKRLRSGRRAHDAVRQEVPDVGRSAPINSASSTRWCRPAMLETADEIAHQIAPTRRPRCSCRCSACGQPRDAVHAERWSTPGRRCGCTGTTPTSEGPRAFAEKRDLVWYEEPPEARDR